MTDWTIDLSTCEARHMSGLVVRFARASRGIWDGEMVSGPMPPIEDAPRLMREAGDAYLAALRARQ